MRNQPKKLIRAYGGGALLLSMAVLLSGCHTDMWVQPKVKPTQEFDFFADKQASRPLVQHTVAQGSLKFDSEFYYGTVTAPTGAPQPAVTLAPNGGKVYVKTIPAQAVRAFGGPKEMLLRGKERFNAYCSPCHGVAGDGQGMISLRGKDYWQKMPASYHEPRLQKVEDGYIYNVLVNGHGVMYGYASRIQDINDRWATVAYIRALQTARKRPVSELSAEEREKLEKGMTSEGGVEESPSTTPAENRGGEKPAAQEGM